MQANKTGLWAKCGIEWLMSSDNVVYSMQTALLLPLGSPAPGRDTSFLNLSIT